MSRSIQPMAAGFSFRPLLRTHFYFAMALLMVAVVAFGFTRTVDANLLHPATPRPAILWVHGLTFVAWLGLFTIQSALVRSHRIRWHKQLGQFGVVLGIAVVIVGLTTSFVMTGFHLQHVLPNANPPSFLAIPLNDMVAFAGLFGAAVLRRRQSEYHRRLMLMATAALTAAGWGRLPEFVMPGPFFYAGVDLIVLLGMARDLVVTGRIHRVYLIGLPCMIAGQAIAMTLMMSAPDWWVSIARAVGTMF